MITAQAITDSALTLDPKRKPSDILFILDAAAGLTAHELRLGDVGVVRRANEFNTLGDKRLAGTWKNEWDEVEKQRARERAEKKERAEMMEKLGVTEAELEKVRKMREEKTNEEIRPRSRNREERGGIREWDEPQASRKEQLGMERESRGSRRARSRVSASATESGELLATKMAGKVGDKAVVEPKGILEAERHGLQPTFPLPPHPSRGPHTAPVSGGSTVATAPIPTIAAVSSAPALAPTGPSAMRQPAVPPSAPAPTKIPTPRQAAALARAREVLIGSQQVRQAQKCMDSRSAESVSSTSSRSVGTGVSPAPAIAVRTGHSVSPAEGVPAVRPMLGALSSTQLPSPTLTSAGLGISIPPNPTSTAGRAAAWASQYPTSFPSARPLQRLDFAPPLFNARAPGPSLAVRLAVARAEQEATRTAGNRGEAGGGVKDVRRQNGDTGDTGGDGESGKKADADAMEGSKRDEEDSDGSGVGEPVAEREMEDRRDGRMTGSQLGRKREREESGEMDEERRVRSRLEQGVKHELGEEGSCQEEREGRKVL